MVPGATAMTTDQVPEAHRWKDVPPLWQFQYPSGLQAVPGVMAPVTPPVATGGAVDVVLRVVDLRVVDTGTVTKTPPGLQLLILA